jgi:hypothetical protein
MGCHYSLLYAQYRENLPMGLHRAHSKVQRFSYQLERCSWDSKEYQDKPRRKDDMSSLYKDTQKSASGESLTIGRRKEMTALALQHVLLLHHFGDIL